MPTTVGSARGVELDHPLLARPLTAVLATELRDGRFHLTPVWFVTTDGTVLVSTMREFAKARHLQARPRATLLVVNPDDTTDWVELRCDVAADDESAASAVRVLDEIAERYTGTRPYFGGVVPAGLAATEHPVTFRLVPAPATTQPPVSGPPDKGRPRRRLVPPRGCAGDVALPTTHRDLLDARIVASLATRLPTGRAQTQPVWFGRDGNDLLVATTLERRKGRNLLADPRATLLVVDPRDSTRWLEVRCDADLTTAGAERQLDELTRAYTVHPHYYGGIAPIARRDSETRVTVRLHPRAVRCDAIHR